ncbi:hypothetical protein [Aridibaculum aurantiacum]|uniref:hypothetical protein n=1 Tax=Aridibaculum aurantiacum TaxID=2810307 RepID=UPI001A9679C3|nr:hypothetical protein [Aridibaculum aurantiacum]
MRGKFITTNLKLAVLAGGKKRTMDVKETKASLENFEIIWSKSFFQVKQDLIQKVKTNEPEMVF